MFKKAGRLQSELSLKEVLTKSIENSEDKERDELESYTLR